MNFVLNQNSDFSSFSGLNVQSKSTQKINLFSKMTKNCTRNPPKRQIDISKCPKPPDTFNPKYNWIFSEVACCWYDLCHDQEISSTSEPTAIINYVEIFYKLNKLCLFLTFVSYLTLFQIITVRSVYSKNRIISNIFHLFSCIFIEFFWKNILFCLTCIYLTYTRFASWEKDGTRKYRKFLCLRLISYFVIF